MRDTAAAAGPCRVESIEIEAADGHRLAARIHWPAQAPRRAALIVAAMGVPQAFYAPFASWLAEQGVAVFTFDFRGMGASRPASLRGFKATVSDWARLDTPAVIHAMRERVPDVPWTWIGHSLGGQIFGMTPGAERFERMVTVAAGSGYWRLNAPRVRWTTPILWHVLAPLSIAASGYFPGARLKAIGDLPAGVMWQWRRWCLHPDYLGSEGPQLRRQYEQVRTPILAAIMEDDELISPEGVRRLYRLYPNAPVRFESLRPQPHGLRRIGHFGLFRKQAGHALWPLALRWIAG